MGRGAFRVDLDFLLVAGDGLVQLVLLRQGVTEGAVAPGVFRVELDGLAVGGDGFVQLPLLT